MRDATLAVIESGTQAKKVRSGAVYLVIILVLVRRDLADTMVVVSETAAEW